MIGYVKSRTNFHTIKTLHVSEYNYCLESVFDDKSTFTVSDNCADIYPRDFLIYDGHIWEIDKISPDKKNTTQIVCNDILNIFSRKIIYNAALASVWTYVEQYIANMIWYGYGGWEDGADPEYQMRYIPLTTDYTSLMSVYTTYTNATAIIAPDVTDGLWDLRSFIYKVRRMYNVATTHEIQQVQTIDHLVFDCSVSTPVSHNIMMNDSAHELISNVRSTGTLVKLTTYQDESTEKTWYLQADGSIEEDTPPSPRLEGDWECISLSATDTDTEKVADYFGKHKSSHKIEFRSANVYDFWDNVSINIDGTVYNSYIAGIYKDSKDDRYFYKTGELQVTLSEKQKELI